MYGKEDKERILADFISSGLSLSAFSRIPGNPSRERIRRWRKQAEEGLLDVPRRNVPGAHEHHKHARYPEATKREALRLLRQGMRPGAIARRLGITSGSVVSSWQRRAQGIIASKGAISMQKEPKRSRTELEAENEELKLQLRACVELMRDPKVEDPKNLSNKQKTALCAKLKKDFGYSLTCLMTSLRISKSTFYYNRQRLAWETKRKEVVARNVRRAFEQSGRRYGYRRVCAVMKTWSEPFYASEREVRDAMRTEGMRPRRTKRRKWSSYAGERGDRPSNQPLKDDGSHDFSASSPNRIVVTDVTEMKVGDTKVYLSPIIDCFDGMPASWRISRHPDSALCDGSLLDYIATLPRAHDRIVVHTDGGSCYWAKSWIGHCANNDLVRSMSRKGCCPDNARAEGFFGSLKEEFYNGRDWSRTNVEDFIEQLDEYIRWYRDKRLKSFRDEGGRLYYDTIANRRKRLGYAA